MTLSILVLFLLILLLLFASSFFSSSETAFFSLDELKMHYFKSHDARSIRKILKDATILLTTLLIANTTVNILLTTVLETFFSELGISFSLIWSTVVVSGIVILFGEIFPKAFAAAQPQVLIPLSINSVSFLMSKLKVVSVPINKMADSITSYFSYLIPETENKQERRIALYNVVLRGNFLKNEEKLLIGRILSLAERKVTAVMTPRPRVFSVENTSTLAELKESLAQELHSKIPIYKEQDSHVIGVLYLEDVAGYCKDNKNLDHTIDQYIRNIYFIPESKTLGDLLEDFKAQNIRIAAIVDEYGDFLGIITLSDILAELVGEVVDEDFEKDTDIAQQFPNRFIVKGEVSLIDFNEKFNVNFFSNEYETIAGFIIEKAGGIPPLFYSFEDQNLIISVRERSATRIESISVRIKS